jgi:hypothetical protein
MSWMLIVVATGSFMAPVTHTYMPSDVACARVAIETQDAAKEAGRKVIVRCVHLGGR